MTTHEQTLKTLCAVLQRHAKIKTTVSADTQLASDLGIDSAELMEVLLEVEDEFDISIPLNVLPEVYSVDDLASALDKLIGGGA